jgi:hypothetical protein
MPRNRQNITNKESFFKEAMQFFTHCDDSGTLDRRQDPMFSLVVPKNKNLTKGMNKKDVAVPLLDMMIISTTDGSHDGIQWGGERREQFRVLMIGNANILKLMRTISGNSSKPLRGGFIVTQNTTLSSKMRKDGRQVAKSHMSYEFLGANGGKWILSAAEGFVIIEVFVSNFNITSFGRTPTGMNGKPKIRKEILEFSSMAAVEKSTALGKK